MKTIQEKLTGAIILIVWMVSFAVYGIVPERMATHWNAQGIADGYSGRVIGLFLLPMIMIALQVMFMVIPRIDPLKENSKAFKRQFDGFALLLALFMTYIYGVTLAWNLGMTFSMNVMIAPAFGLLFYGIGVLLKDVKRNWFIGIRTPWTMSSDVVWDKTHSVGSTVFKMIGLLSLFGALFPRYMIVFLIGPVVIGSIGVVAYSYWVFRNKK